MLMRCFHLPQLAHSLVHNGPRHSLAQRVLPRAAQTFKFGGWMCGSWGSTYTLTPQALTTFKVTLHASAAWALQGG